MGLPVFKRLPLDGEPGRSTPRTVEWDREASACKEK